MPLISVILPTRDRPELLLRAVRSVLAQEGKLELILVDNNSATPALSEKAYSELSDSRVRIIRGPEARNAAQARNCGLEAAGGDWITYLDDDDEYLPGKLQKQLVLATAQSANIVLCGAELRLNGRTRKLQCQTEAIAGDALLNEARYSTPLLFHKSDPEVRFDGSLSAGEDAHFAHQLLSLWNMTNVPVASAPLVTMHQDGPDRPRTNLRGVESWRAARRIWWQFGHRYSASARHLYVRRALVAREKILGHRGACLRYSLGLLRAGGFSQFRYVLNALALSYGFCRGRLVT